MIIIPPETVGEMDMSKDFSRSKRVHKWKLFRNKLLSQGSMQNFEADLFMMVSRPSETNLGGRRSKYDFSKVAKKK